MPTDRWAVVQDLFHRAVDLEPGARRVLLDEACGADHELRSEVEQLLRGDQTGSDAISRFEAITRTESADPFLGSVLGSYRLVERLGQGGMGVVYRGERQDGLFQHEVAIKRIRAECASEWMLRRFELERRTLAALQHPGIARLLDGGTTADGGPWFAMEFVRGQTIESYCDRERLTLEKRLRLFLQVCRAVQYAHQNLVVHCDLKPANILIDERGQPRLLDFGIARLLDDGTTGSGAPATRTIGLLLTPEYASPEQLVGAPVTTADDVYSLGVILYELATGTRRFATGKTSLAEVSRAVEHGALERPSTRVGAAPVGVDGTALAARFRTTQRGLRRALRGDLDRIILMAMRREPERRYASVQEFASDLERHLDGLPVRARGDSFVYIATKFIRRHRLAVAAGTLSLIALLVAFERARRSERNAQSEAMHAQMEADSFHGIADFLMDAFLPVQPAQDAEWQARARARILAHRDRVHRQFAESPHERANLLDTLGQVCLRLDLTVDAESLMREAFVLRTESYGRASLEAALSLRSLGQLRYRTGAFDDGAQLLAEALAIHRATPNSTHADVAALANDLAACLHNLGRDDEALSLHREALALRRVQAPGSLSVAESLNNLAGVHLARSEFAAAVTVLREALSIRSGILGDAHVLTLQTMSNLASALWRNQEFDEARSIMQRAEVGYVALGGDGEDGLGILLANLAAMQLQVRDLDGASDSLERAMVLQRRRLGNDHPVLAATFAKLANVAHARSLDEVARAHWQEAMRVRQASPTSPFDLAETLLGQSKFLLDVGDFDAAAESAAAALAAFRRSDRADAVSQGRAELVLGASFAQLGRLSVAREHLLEAARLLKDANSSTPAERARVQELLDDVARRAGG